MLHCINGLAVLENTVKWRNVAPAPDVRSYEAGDADVAWAADLGFPIKGHTLLWGNAPPLSSSGVPAWLERALYDPQTSGGHLIALPEANGASLLKGLKKRGIEKAKVIGRSVSGSGRITIRP